jgi:hypothetical protein
MSAEEVIKAWREDPEQNVVIYAGKFWDPVSSRGIERQCETCGRPVSVWPVVISKKRENPEHVHIICRAKCMPIAIRVSGAIPFGGRIRDNVLPQSLEEFKK